LARIVCVLALLLAIAAPSLVRGAPPTPEASLAVYRAELNKFRAEFGGEARELPNVRFFLFGMGGRVKLLYKDGALIDATTGKAVRRWVPVAEVIDPPGYRVALSLAGGKRVTVAEDEEAVWVEEDGRRSAIDGTRSSVKLPDFAGHRYAGVLRVLHQELLVNVTQAGPVPNLFVYARPWYRDGAMMAMALRETGNLATIKTWVAGLREPFDHNNKGESEPDNLGQALFLVAVTGGDASHPLVPKVLDAAKKFEVTGQSGRMHLKGRSDFAFHPVYQTKWMKYGLAALGLPDPYTIPKEADSYSALFWMDYRNEHVRSKDAADRNDYPYLGWACDHFYRTKKSPIGNRDYPLTWEQNASEAQYAGMRVIDPIYVTKKLSAPHTWHAAEVFLFVLGEGSDSRADATAAHGAGFLYDALTRLTRWMVERVPW
jgi:hypothetical protein